MPDAEMPRYKCHKEVHALKIGAIEGLWIYPAEDGYGPFEVSGDFFERTKPTVGGYYVVYKDGYASVFPAEVFEEGYTLVQQGQAYGRGPASPPTTGVVEGQLPG